MFRKNLNKEQKRIVNRVYLSGIRSNTNDGNWAPPPLHNVDRWI